MYGQKIEHQNPNVRAILLEMQRRKMNTGADALRIDGGQDFQFFNPLSGEVEYDDEYLKAMADIPQEIQRISTIPLPHLRKMDAPWPNPGWEEIATYRDVLEYLPHTVQWGPLIFAHNKPTVKNFLGYKVATGEGGDGNGLPLDYRLRQPRTPCTGAAGLIQRGR